MVITYRITVSYHTESMDKVTELTQRILSDWRRKGTRLVATRTWEFSIDRPLTNEEKEKVLSAKEGWMDDITIEEVSRDMEKTLDRAGEE